MLLTPNKNSIFEIHGRLTKKLVTFRECEQFWVGFGRYWRESPPDSDIFENDESIKKSNNQYKIRNYVNSSQNCSLQMLEWCIKEAHLDIYFNTGFLYHINEKYGAPYEQIYKFLIPLRESGHPSVDYFRRIKRTPKSSKDLKFIHKLGGWHFDCKNIGFKDGDSGTMKRYYEDIWKFSQLLKN